MTTTTMQCPECEETTVQVPCDECKFGTCMACGYPCACPDVEEAYATAKAENDAAADLGPEA
jgi:hypothetical protein